MIKQLVLESEVQRLTEEEMHAYVKNRLKHDISIESLYKVKRKLRQNTMQQISHLRKHRTAFIDQLFFKRVHELETYQKELWRIYHRNKDNGAVQKACITELHQVTVTLANLYEALPQISGITFFTGTGGGYNGEKDLSSVLSSSSNKDSEDPENYKPVV